MTTYSYAQMEQLWINAGGSRALAPIAAAIGEAESGGNSTALNPNDNGGTQSSFGIWQISNGTHTPPSANWSNPAVNAQLAVAKWRGAGGQFTPWGTFESGAYKRFLNNSTTPSGAGIPGPTSGPPGTTTPGGPGATLASSTPTCAIAFPGLSIPVAGSVGGFCLISKPQVRAMLGGITMGAGGVVLVVGIAFLGVYGLARSRTVSTIVALSTGGRVASSGGQFRYRGSARPAPSPAPVTTMATSP